MEELKTKKEYFRLFKDILKERNKYSQGRVYLLWSIIAYYITLGILTLAGLKQDWDVEMDKFKMIIDALEYAMTLFGGYVFGGKFINAYQAIKSPNTTSQSNEEIN
jgi:hypothetical protein